MEVWLQLYFLGRYIVYHPIGLKKNAIMTTIIISFFRKLIYVTADAVMIRDYLQETSFSQKNKILKSPGNVIAAKVYSSLRISCWNKYQIESEYSSTQSVPYCVFISVHWIPIFTDFVVKLIHENIMAWWFKNYPLDLL